MKATIRPLKGKYYGTEIDIVTDSGNEALLTVWVACGSPSDREIESWGHTRADWEANLEIDDGWGGKKRIQSADYLCDSHYECEESLMIAKKIVKALSDA